MYNIRTTKILLDKDNYTENDWFFMIKEMCKCIVEISEWVYYHFLECVPPIYPKNQIGFFNSEPINHNKNGQPIYYYFFKLNNKYYGCMTTKDTQEFCYKLAKQALNQDLKKED